MTIKVCNNHFHVKTENDIPIHRPSIFGSPYSHLESDFPDAVKVSSRKEAVELYISYFLDKYKNNVEFKEAVDTMVEAHKNCIDINLLCYCSPHECHGDIIKKFIEFKAFADINKLEIIKRNK